MAKASKTANEGNGMSTMVQELSDERLAEVLSSSRAHGNYDTALEEYINSGLRGAEINLKDGVLEGKKPASVKTGFEGAKRRATKEGSGRSEDFQAAANATKVISHNDSIFLVRQDIAA